MENERSLIKSAPNGLFLAGAGAVMLFAKGLLFAGPIEYLVAGAAAIWGGYILLTDRTRRNAGLASLAGAGVLVLFGGLLQALPAPACWCCSAGCCKRARRLPASA